MTRCCSQCGSDGHNARTCDQSKATGGGIMLFGVRVGYQDPLRKTVSMNDLASYQQPNGDNNALKIGDESKGKAVDDSDAAGYVSADDAVQHQNTGGRERKRGKPWTEEEHKLFLLGLQKVGKGDWRGISRKFVKTRTPTQVASHAQKYFIRKNNLSRRRRRSSLFDITTDSVTDESMDGVQDGEQNVVRPVLPMTSLPAPEMVNNMRNFAVTPVPFSVPPGFLPMQAQYTLNPMTGYQGNHQLQNPSAMLLYPLF